MSSVKHETLVSVKWSLLERFATQVMQFGLGLVLARLLLPSDFGAVGMLAIFLALSQTFVDSGFGQALIRKLDRTEQDFSTVFCFNLVVAVLLYGVLFACAPLISRFFSMPVLTPLLRVQALTLLVGALMGIHQVKLTIRLDFRGMALRSLLSCLVGGVAGIVCAWRGLGVWALVVQALTAQVVNLVFVWLYLRWRPRLTFSWTSFREMGSFGSKLLASSLLHTGYMHLTTLIIGRCFSARDLGYYNRGTQFAQLPVDTMNGVLGKVLYPILVKLQHDDAHLVRVYRKYISMMSLVIVPGCLLLAAVARPLIYFLLTPKSAEAARYLQIYACAIMFDHVCSLNLTLLTVKGRSDLFLRLEIIKKTISVAMLLAAVPYGVAGICVSRVLYTQLAVALNTYYTGRLFGIGYFTQMLDFMRYFVLAFLACLPAALLCLFAAWPSWLLLAAGSLLALLLYALLLRRDAVALEVVQLVRSSLHRQRPS